MNDITQKFSVNMESLHEKAMLQAEEALFFKRSGNLEGFQRKCYLAFALERIVAEAYIKSERPANEIEPSRSIICMSAAALAKDAGRLEDARKYVDLVLKYNYNKRQVLQAKHFFT